MARVTDDGTVAVICGAKKRDGEQCRAKPIKGGTRCTRHGGAAPQVAKKAQERIIETNARGILGRIDPEAPREHPVETLLNLIRSKNAEVQWLRTRVQNLTEGELVWGLTEHREGIAQEGPVDVNVHKAEINVWYRLLREAENQLASWITSALRSGVEERKVRLAESQGMAVAGVIRKVLDGLNLTPDQVAMVPILVPNALRELTGELA